MKGRKWEEIDNIEGFNRVAGHFMKILNDIWYAYSTNYNFSFFWQHTPNMVCLGIREL